jgi:hypothetical protein
MCPFFLNLYGRLSPPGDRNVLLGAAISVIRNGLGRLRAGLLLPVLDNAGYAG